MKWFHSIAQGRLAVPDPGQLRSKFKFTPQVLHTIDNMVYDQSVADDQHGRCLTPLG